MLRLLLLLLVAKSLIWILALLGCQAETLLILVLELGVLGSVILESTLTICIVVEVLILLLRLAIEVLRIGGVLGRFQISKGYSMLGLWMVKTVLIIFLGTVGVRIVHVVVEGEYELVVRA